MAGEHKGKFGRARRMLRDRWCTLEELQRECEVTEPTVFEWFKVIRRTHEIEQEPANEPGKAGGRPRLRYRLGDRKP